MAPVDFAARDPILAAKPVLGVINVPFVLKHSKRIIDPAFWDRILNEAFKLVMNDLKGK